MKKTTDRELVEMARRGDNAAMAELFSRYWRAVRAAAFGITGEFASAEDAAAEAFKEALVSIGSLRDPDRFGPWLRTIAVRKAMHAIQKQSAGLETVIQQENEATERSDIAFERHQLAELIR